ncbi:hypothetical protein QOZ80_3BG0269710 [Eleusine coracana subsp. coracana]|nr:hypothetical protein QOZ80_3BG0269710 [Eleusine coracana subsp. coracana]
MAMRTPSFFLLLLVLATCTAAVATNKPLMPAVSAPGPSSSTAASFLRASCAPAHQPETCYNMLLPYADSFHGSLARVARTSASLAIDRQQALTDEIARLKLRGTGAGSRADITLGSCFDTVSNSGSYPNVTLGRLDDLVAGVKSKKQFDWEKLLAQDWLYSSVSAMYECVDWIHDAGEAAMSSPVLKKVIAGCTTAVPYMEIAVDLTNSLKF